MSSLKFKKLQKKLSLGRQIRKSRKQRDLTLRKLASKIHRTHTLLSLIENGKHDPSEATLISLAKELGSNFGEPWLDEYIKDDLSKVDINISIQKLLGLKFEITANCLPIELDFLSQLLDKEVDKRLSKFKKKGSDTGD